MGTLEKEVELHLVKRVRELGGKAFKIISPGNNGFPDRLVCLPGNRVFLVETKKPGDKPRRLQLRQIVLLRSLGIEVLVIDTKAQVDAFYDVLFKEINHAK